MVIFNQKKHKVAQAGGFVQFWTFEQKHALFHRQSLKARALTGSIPRTVFFFKACAFRRWGTPVWYRQWSAKIATVHATAWHLFN